MSLRVEVSAGLFDEVRAAADAAGGDRRGLRKQLESIARNKVFGADGDAIAGDVEHWFDLDHLLRREGAEADAVVADHLVASAERGAAALAPFLPPQTELPPQANMGFTVHVVPSFELCYGSSPGTQVFGIRPGADPREAFLFLVHVCYHEITEWFYTETSRRASAERDGPAVLRHWILLLVQNEGLANYAVLEPLLAIRDELPRHRYFTYADGIGDAGVAVRALTMLQRALVSIDEENWGQLEPRIVAFLKDPRLPVINLAGIHVACAIAAAHGTEALVASIREPQQFFALYADSPDPLREHLFGPHGEAVEACGLLARSEPRP